MPRSVSCSQNNTEHNKINYRACVIQVSLSPQTERAALQYIFQRTHAYLRVTRALSNCHRTSKFLTRSSLELTRKLSETHLPQRSSLRPTGRRKYNGGDSLPTERHKLSAFYIVRLRPSRYTIFKTCLLLRCSPVVPILTCLTAPTSVSSV